MIETRTTKKEPKSGLPDIELPSGKRQGRLRDPSFGSPDSILGVILGPFLGQKLLPKTDKTDVPKRDGKNVNFASILAPFWPPRGVKNQEKQWRVAQNHTSAVFVRRRSSGSISAIFGTILGAQAAQNGAKNRSKN